MRRLCGMVVVVMSLLGAAGGAVVAQEDVGGDPSFSDQLLTTLGLPEINLRQTVDGTITGAPSEVAAGRYLVSMASVGEIASYVNFVQVPAGLSPAEATAQMLDAARNDTPHEGFLYGGGSYALDNTAVRFVVEVTPGDWRIAISRQAGFEGEEVMQLLPLTVTGGSAIATPMAGEIPATVTLELRDVAFGGLARPVPAGPRIWQVTNVGEQPRQVVYWRVPRAVTTDEFLQMMGGLMSGTPVAGGLTPDQMTWVGYAAILSPGQTVWEEFDFAPGNYLVVSYVFDPAAGLPAFLLGMVQPFTVEGDGATPVASPGATPAV